MIRHRAVAVLGIGLVVPSTVAAQADTLVVRGTCSDCELQLEPVAILGGADLPFELGWASNVAVMSDGTLIVAPTMNEGEIAVFDRTGQFERVVGRSGQGPGEYGGIRTVLTGPGDTVRVMEREWVTTLRPDLSFVHRHPLEGPAADAWTILPSGALVVLATRMGRGFRAPRLHLVGPDGRFVTSFAPAPRPYDPGYDINERPGALWPSTRYGGLWYAKMNRYAVELFVDRVRRRVIAREIDWFRPWEGLVSGEGFRSPPRPAVTSFAERPDGLVMFVVRRADANWERNQADFARTAGPEGPRVSDFNRGMIFDAVIEVIDPETGEVRARKESDDHIRGAIGDGTLVVIPRQDQIGRVRIHIYRVSLPAEP